MSKRVRQDDDGREENDSPTRKVRISTADEVFFIDKQSARTNNYPTRKPLETKIDDYKKKLKERFEKRKYLILDQMLKLENKEEEEEEEEEEKNRHNVLDVSVLDNYFKEIMSNKMKINFKNNFISRFNFYLDIRYNNKKKFKYTCLASTEYPTVLYVGPEIWVIDPEKFIEKSLGLGQSLSFGWKPQPQPQIVYNIVYPNNLKTDELMSDGGKKSRRKGKSNKNTKSKKHKLTYKSKKTNKSKTRKTNK